MIRVGCCGFPEARDRYFAEFPLVEIQLAFYQPPRVETARGWREKAPEGFEFTLKAWQLITHEASSPTYRRLREKIPPERLAQCGGFRPTAEVHRAWERTAEIARVLQAAVILFQCPAAFRPTAENRRNLERFFRRLPRGKARLAWEPRGEWRPDEVARLCRDLDLVYCVDPFQGTVPEGEIRYYRLHGITGYRHRFTDEELSRL